MSKTLLSLRLVRKAYPHSVPTVCTICSSNSKYGRIDCGISFGSIYDRNANKSAVAPSDLRIWSKDTSYVVAIAFCEPLYRVLS